MAHHEKRRKVKPRSQQHPSYTNHDVREGTVWEIYER